MNKCDEILYKNLRSVLIDTWWNVNQVKLCSAAEKVVVLIDTWWNVNILIETSETRDTTVLIDTWWNVNSES